MLHEKSSGPSVRNHLAISVAAQETEFLSLEQLSDSRRLQNEFEFIILTKILPLCIILDVHQLLNQL